jgi:hypothetical protein
MRRNCSLPWQLSPYWQSRGARSGGRLAGRTPRASGVASRCAVLAPRAQRRGPRSGFTVDACGRIVSDSGTALDDRCRHSAFTAPRARSKPSVQHVSSYTPTSTDRRGTGGAITALGRPTPSRMEVSGPAAPAPNRLRGSARPCRRGTTVRYHLPPCQPAPVPTDRLRRRRHLSRAPDPPMSWCSKPRSTTVAVPGPGQRASRTTKATTRNRAQLLPYPRRLGSAFETDTAS